MNKHLLFLVLLFSFSLGYSQTKDSLSAEEKARREKNIQAGNPFKKFGYKPKIATLSKGKYLEFHDLDSIVKIGSFSYHVKKKYITGYTRIDPNNSEAGLSPEVISRWLSPDPLAEEFPSWSPYNFVENNPIRLTDPTGLAPEDIHAPDDRYKLLANGTIEYYDNKGGETVDYLMDSDGNEIKINNTSLLPQLEKKQNHNGTDVLMASTDSNGKRDLANIFVFIANRSDNEWRMIQTKSSKYILGSKFDPDYSPSSTALGLTGDSEIKNSVHSHPNIYIKPGDSRFLSEQKSMGYFLSKYSAFGDWGNTVNAVENNNMKYPFREYIYMPESGRLWNAGYNKPIYIRNLNNDGNRLFFGRF